MLKLFVILVLFLNNQVSFSQKFVTISGKIYDLTNSMIYLGNKSFSFGNKNVIFDSVFSKDGSFEFVNFKFAEINFYSIQHKGSPAWLPFLIDSGHIFITADKGFLSLGKVRGSNENDLFHSYSKNIVGPYFIANRSDFDSINKYRNIDSNLFRQYSELIKREDSIYLFRREEFIKQHPESYVSLIILNDIEDQISLEKLRFYFNLLSSEMRHHSKAVKLRKRVKGI